MKPPTDPPSPRSDKPHDEASPRQAPPSPRSDQPSDETPHAPPPPARRPGVHGSYRLAESNYQLAEQRAYVPSDDYDDGVPRHHPGDDEELHNVEVAHEHTDINVRAVVTSVVILTVVAIVAHVLMYLLFGWFEQTATANDRPVSPVAAPAVTMPATTMESPYFSSGVSGPQLLTNEPMALAKQRAEEEKRLHGYGWMNEAGGVAHIPIEQAKKLILERGLPVREAEQASPALGTTLPARGEASGGRIITAPPPEAPAPPAGQQPAAEPGHEQPQGQQPKPATPGAKPHGSGGV